MKKIFSVLAAALSFALYAEATVSIETDRHDTDAHIHGHVVDKITGEHLPYIVVMIKGTTIGVATESTGHYMIRNVPEGKVIMEVSAVGYKTQSREVTISKGRS